MQTTFTYPAGEVYQVPGVDKEAFKGCVLNYCLPKAQCVQQSMCNGKFALHILKGEGRARNVSDQKKLERIPPRQLQLRKKVISSGWYTDNSGW